MIALFRRDIDPAIIMIRCMNHRIELALKASMKSSTLFGKVDMLLSDLFHFYHKSPKQTSNLKETANALGVKYMKPTRIGGTRWVGHVQTALCKLWKGYEAFVTHLDQVFSFSIKQCSMPIHGTNCYECTPHVLYHTHTIIIMLLLIMLNC